MTERKERRPRVHGPSSSSSSSPSSSSSTRNRPDFMQRDAAMKEPRAGNKLEKMAGWVGAGLHSAFFLSLDRCQCVKLDTLDWEQPILLRKPLLLADHHNRDRHHQIQSPPCTAAGSFNGQDGHPHSPIAGLTAAASSSSAAAAPSPSSLQ